MKTVELGAIASFIRGVTFKPADVLDKPSPDSVPVMRTKNVQADLDLSDIIEIPRHLAGRPNQRLQAGDVLISSANSWNLVGKCCWVPELERPASIGGFVTALRANSSQIDSRYLYRWFAAPRTQAMIRNTANQTTNIANLNLRRCEQLQVPLPSLSEQRRIAAILDQADALRTKRWKMVAHLDALASATFDHLFSGNKFQSSNLGDHILDQQIGLDRRASEQGVCRRYEYIKMDAITRAGRLDLRSIKRIDASEIEVAKYSVIEGDLLFNTRNSRDLVGKTAVYRGSPRLYNNNLMRIRFDGELLPDYVHSYLWSAAGREQIDARKSGTTNVFAIYARSLATLQIPVPPIALQEFFRESIAKSEAVRSRISRQIELDNVLFVSLQSRAFRGGL